MLAGWGIPPTGDDGDLGSSTRYVTRAEAMTLGAVRRGRGVIAGVLGSLPLHAFRGHDVIDNPAPTLLTQPDPDVPRATTLSWTADDQLFYGFAVWLIPADWCRADTGYPFHARRVDPRGVTLDERGAPVRVTGYELGPGDRLIRIDGPDEGLCSAGDTVRTALDLQRAIRRISRLEVPLGVIQNTGGAELTDEQVDTMLARWDRARRKRATAYLNATAKFDAFTHDARSVQLAELYTAHTTELARAMNLPPRYLAAPTGSSLTYSTVETERRDLVDLTLAPYLAGVEQRLSMDDLTPHGTAVRFAVDAFLRGDTKARYEAHKVGLEAGFLTVNEVRELEDRDPLPGGDSPPAPPSPGGAA